MRRMIFHNLPSLISVGVDVTNNGDVFVAFAACNHKDQPERKWANKILNARLASDKGNRCFYMGNYGGEDIGKEVFGPIRDSIRQLEPRRNVRGVPSAVHTCLREDDKGVIRDAIWSDESSPVSTWRDCCSGKSCTMSPAAPGSMY